MQNIEAIAGKVQALRQFYAERDSRMAKVFAARRGKIGEIFPEMFNDDFPEPIVANFIDTVARDVAEVMAPLPAFNCSASNMVSDAARKRADKRTKGAQHYIDHSQLQTQMYLGCDRFGTFGFLPFLIEPDFEAMTPRIVIDDPMGAYPEYDRWGRVVSYTRCAEKEIHEIVAEFPEYAGAITGPYQDANSTAKLEMVLYRDADDIVLYLPQRNNLILRHAPNPLGECPVVVARRSDLKPTDPRGSYDDILWVQVARARFSMLALEAAEDAVEAPLALPNDVQEFATGPKATIYSASPEKIRKVGTELPQAAFAESQLLDNEMRVGARYPAVRSGNFDASIITGRGVQELVGGFDTQIQAGQAVLAVALKDVIRLCYKMDETYWPNIERSIAGNADGTPYEIKWKPSRDIAGDHTIDVKYGFAAGLDPNRALVLLLQMLGAQLLSKDTVRRQFPFGINVDDEERMIDIENYRSALTQATAAYAQAIPALAAQGGDPGQVLQRLSDIINSRKRGMPLEEAVSKAFAPEPPPVSELSPGSGGAPASPGAPGELPGGGAPLPQSAPGGGGPPDLLTLLAGLNSGGNPTNTVNVRRAVPA